MSDTFVLSGAFTSKPDGASASGDPTVDALLDERLSLQAKTSFPIELETDAAVDAYPATFAAGGSHVLIVKSLGGKVRVRVTSADGATQAYPVDTLLVLISESVPFTAVDVMRVAGQSTSVRCFVGQLPS